MTDLQIIKQAVERAVKTVTLRPERGQRVYRNTATVDDGLFCQVEEAGQCITMDMPKALGGDASAPNPSMVLRSAMSACVAIGIKQWAARRDVPIDRVEVTVATDVDARGQLGVVDDLTPGFEGIRLNIAVTSSSPSNVVEDIVQETLKYSPLMDVFIRPQSVTHRVVTVSDDAAELRETVE